MDIDMEKIDQIDEIDQIDKMDIKILKDAKNIINTYYPHFFDSFGKNRIMYEQAKVIVSLIEEKNVSLIEEKNKER